jgi:hypothetical protein
MKNLKLLIAFVFAALLFGCSDDENSLVDLDNAGAPTNVSALFTITQDNTGFVTISPNADGATHFDVYFGDGTTEPVEIVTGKNATHTYDEGVYDVHIVAYAVNGKSTDYTQSLTVTFIAPQNLDITVTPTVGNSFSVDATATADYETFFEVWFGESDGETPVQFNEGQVISHVYAAVGTYTVKVVAYSGGAATAELTEEVTIVDPLVLPITFESPTLPYSFIDFGNEATSVVDNPDATGINTSSKVGKSIKNPGAETWAGTVLTLDGTIDFSTLTTFRVKVWSPMTGAIVKLKIENLTDATQNYEVDAVTTVTNQWEELTYNFSGANMDQEYSKVILFFNFNVTGSGEVFYFDDIALIPASGTLSLPLDFEYASVDYIFNNFGGAFGSKVVNPNVGGINTSGNIGQVIKNSGSETWAGVAIPMIAPIDFSSMQKVKMKVWSPAPGLPVLMKFENIPNTTSTELLATTTVAGGWEELTYDFTGINNANNYQNLVLFFDFGNPGTGATYYFDDVKLSN